MTRKANIRTHYEELLQEKDKKIEELENELKIKKGAISRLTRIIDEQDEKINRYEEMVKTICEVMEAKAKENNNG